AQPHVHAREPLRDRRRHGPLERDFVAANRFDQRDRQRLAGLLERDDAGVVLLPGDRHAGCAEHAHDGVGDFRPDAVSGNERNRVCHSRAYQMRRANPRMMLIVTSVAATSLAAASDAAAAITSISAAMAARATNPRGGGPMNFRMN